MIPFLNVRRQTASIRGRLDEAVARVLDHGQFILGPEVQQLEDRVAAYCGTRFAVACASGSDALLLPLMALGVGPGDRVVTSPFTFFATAGSIARLGATPVFVDIDAETFNLDPSKVEAALRQPGVKAVLPVDLFGQCAEMGPINEAAARSGVRVIEDAAQAIGAEYKGRRAGSLGWCGSISFFPSKNLGGFGDGGIVTTDDEELAARLRLLRVHGSGATYYHREVGINSRLDTLQAAMLLVEMDFLDEWTCRRRAHAAAYRSGLAGVDGVTLPVERPNGKHVYNQFTIRVRERDAVRRRLTELGVPTAVYYPLPLHLQECFAGLGYREGDLPVSEAAAREVLSLPVDPGLTGEELGMVIAGVREAVGGAMSLQDSRQTRLKSRVPQKMR